MSTTIQPVRVEPAGEAVDLGDDWTVPERVAVTVENLGGYDVAIVGEYRPESGRYEAQNVCVTRRDIEVTGEGLRGIPLAGILRGAVAEVVLQPFEHDPPPDVRSLAAQGPTDETLRWVAKWYRLALLLGDPPTRRIVEVLGVPRATAGRWVTRARDRGFLTVQDPRGGRRG